MYEIITIKGHKKLLCFVCLESCPMKTKTEAPLPLSSQGLTGCIAGLGVIPFGNLYVGWGATSFYAVGNRDLCVKGRFIIAAEFYNG